MAEETLFHLVALGLMVPALAMGMYFRLRARKAGGDVSRRGEGLPILVSRCVLGIAVWLTLLAYLINPASLEWSRMPLPVWLRWSGVALLELSVGLMYWVFVSLGTNITDTVTVRENAYLVTDGIYRWVRHPLYSVATLTFIAVTLITARWIFALISLPLLGVLVLRTDIEEQKLIERFGDAYRSYMGRTGRFFPRLGRPDSGVRGAA